MSLNVDLSGKGGIVVDGGSTEEPCTVHMANQEGLEVSLHELACPAHKFGIDDLDSGNGGVGHGGVTRPRPRNMRYGGDGARESQNGREAGELHLDRLRLGCARRVDTNKRAGDDGKSEALSKIYTSYAYNLVLPPLLGQPQRWSHLHCSLVVSFSHLTVDRRTHQIWNESGMPVMASQPDYGIISAKKHGVGIVSD